MKEKNESAYDSQTAEWNVRNISREKPGFDEMLSIYRLHELNPRNPKKLTRSSSPFECEGLRKIINII